MTGCNKGKGQKKGFLPDSSVYASQNYSDLVLDSAAVTSFLQTAVESDSIRSEVNHFYGRRGYQLGWFNRTGMTCAAPNFQRQLQSYSQDFADNSLKNKQLDALMADFEADENGFMAQKKQMEALDLWLTVTFFKYAQKVYGGTTKSPLDLEWYIPRKKKNYQMVLDSLVSSALCEKLQEPVNQYYIRLKDQLKKYRAIQKRGGFPLIVTNKKLLSVGENDSCLQKVKQHLFLTGDLAINDQTIAFTDSLAQAVRVFQKRMGLLESGKIDPLTQKEMNQSIDFRIRQIMLNMERLRWLPAEVEKDYLLVNIPEFRLHVFENSQQMWVTNVVVGKAATKTSIFKGNLSQIVLNPYWGVPMSIVKKEILPKMKRNSNYLAQNNIEVIDGNYRQKPGKNNALGKMKFLFPNNYHIYLHDTPAKGLFGESKRAFSHGCIRVENPKKLANYLLRNNEDWNPEKVDEILKTDTQTGIRVSPTVPVYIAYFTAWVDRNGQLNFRNDLYGLDKKLAKEVFGE